MLISADYSSSGEEAGLSSTNLLQQFSFDRDVTPIPVFQVALESADEVCQWTIADDNLVACKQCWINLLLARSLQIFPAWKLEHSHCVVVKNCLPMFLRNRLLVCVEIRFHRRQRPVGTKH